MERLIERVLFASRWLLAPIYLGLSLALLALGIKFFQELWHLLGHIAEIAESDMILAMIDMALVASLVVMVMFSGDENFVSRIDLEEGEERLYWLGKLDAGTLKLKVAASIVAISSIHLLRVFVNVPHVAEDKADVVRDPAPDLRRLGGAHGRARPHGFLRAPGSLAGISRAK